MRTLLIALIEVSALAGVFGQTFEVASVKPSNQPNGRPQGGGGPGTRDPERLHFENIPMRDLLIMAYGLDQYQRSGPSWLASPAYDIDAKIPPGATKEQFRTMLQNLLAERFSLKVHHETKEFAGFELIAAKSGPKLKDAEIPSGAISAPAASDPAARPKVGKDKDGLPELPPGAVATMLATTPIGTRMSARGQPLSTLVLQLKSLVKSPVNDETGLSGKYDFNLTFSQPNATTPASADPADTPAERAPDLFIALEDQLGLKLLAKKLAIDVVVVDHLEKSPTEN